jgi:hypothetical protein
MSKTKIPFLVLVTLAICACSSLKTKTKGQEQTLGYIKSVEKHYIRRDPVMGLALSGGGTRSASFNIGLLSGLQDGDKLKDFDYISSVSGGSYAALWFFSKLYLQSTGLNSSEQQSFIFKKCYNAQENNDDELEKLSNLMYYNEFVPHEIEGNDDCYVVDMKNFPNANYEDIFHYRFQRHLTNNSVLSASQ